MSTACGLAVSGVSTSATVAGSIVAGPRVSHVDVHAAWRRALGMGSGVVVWPWRHELRGWLSPGGRDGTV